MRFEVGDSGSEALRRLASLAVPPAAGGNTVDWGELHPRYEHRFPSDFQRFMRVYGEGVFDNFLSICGPVSEVYPQDPGASIDGLTADARFTAEEEDFENPDLLIGWGFTTDADLLCWYANDPEPDLWTTIIWRRNWAPPESWMRFECGMVELVLRYVHREIPHFSVSDLRYSGSRFIHNRDKKRYRSLRLDPWGVEPVHD